MTNKTFIDEQWSSDVILISQKEYAELLHCQKIVSNIRRILNNSNTGSPPYASHSDAREGKGGRSDG